jgi:hypothetical protein
VAISYGEDMRSLTANARQDAKRIHGRSPLVRRVSMAKNGCRNEPSSIAPICQRPLRPLRFKLDGRNGKMKRESFASRRLIET